MGRGLSRYIALLGLFIKIGLMREMAYRPHFILMVTGKVIRLVLLFFFFQAVFLKVDHIGQWSYNGVLLLFATFHLVDYMMSITFQRNLAFHLPALIQSGELDSRIILPVNLLFFVSLEKIDVMDFVSSLPCLAFLGYVLYRLDFAFSWVQALTYLLLLANAFAFLFASVLLIATVSFWTTQSQGLARIFDNLLRIARYPLDIHKWFWKAVFIYVLPLIMVAQLPSQALLQVLSPGTLTLACCVSGTLVAIALNVWKAGLRNYLSSGT